MMWRQRGFTLLEVVVALAILSIALLAAVKGISEHVGNTAYLKERSFAHWVAMNKVAELQLGNDWPGAGVLKGTAEMGGADWHWEVTVSETPNPEIRRLDVRVTPEAHHGQTLDTLIAYLGKPQ